MFGFEFPVAFLHFFTPNFPAAPSLAVRVCWCGEFISPPTLPPGNGASLIPLLISSPIFSVNPCLLEACFLCAFPCSVQAPLFSLGPCSISVRTYDYYYPGAGILCACSSERWRPCHLPTLCPRP